MSSRQDREREHFDQLAGESGEIWWGSTTYAGKRRLQRRADLIAAFLKGRGTGLAVLELGCGTGALTQYLLERLSVELTACDISPVTVERIRERYGAYPNTHFLAADATNLDVPAGSFDVVLGNSVLHHLPLEPALREIHRVLKPGGVLWFSEPNMLNPQIALEKNVRFIGERLQNSEDETAFFRWSLARKLRSQGFAQVQVRPYDFLHPIVPAPLVPLAAGLGELLEATPLLREIAGSLEIHGVRG
ncbi:MAG: class I SAM-dependent methyltransferase [Candidatus Eremiobacteraeota bacterium]|nr:class I SAM-dependent methyltransferase [Candidatus Eremiobacteraeota bacterium]